MRYIFIAVLLLPVASCGGAPLESSPAAPGNLAPTPGFSGQVQDFSTGAGVPGVTVAFGDSSVVTTAAGRYNIPITTIGTYYPTIDGQAVGMSHVTGESYRGDLFVRTGTCIARYGTVSDRALHNAISGVTLSLGGKTTLSGPDGWYRLDYGCPPEGWFGFNTIFIYASHPDYADTSVAVGRGIRSVLRLDIEMQRK
jgi:hypothetical protein